MILTDNNSIKNNSLETIYERVHPDEAENIVNFMQNHPEVAFCQWQDTKLTHKILLESSTFAFTAKKGTQIIGVIIGGIMGSRGTINHLAVSENYRQQGIGIKLVDICVKQMKNSGIERAFVFVSDTNAVAEKFWSRRGFQEISSEKTLECDL